MHGKVFNISGGKIGKNWIEERMPRSWDYVEEMCGADGVGAGIVPELKIENGRIFLTKLDAMTFYEALTSNIMKIMNDHELSCSGRLHKLEWILDQTPIYFWYDDDLISYEEMMLEIADGYIRPDPEGFEILQCFDYHY